MIQPFKAGNKENMCRVWNTSALRPSFYLAKNKQFADFYSGEFSQVFRSCNLPRFFTENSHRVETYILLLRTKWCILCLTPTNLMNICFMYLICVQYMNEWPRSIGTWGGMTVKGVVTIVPAAVMASINTWTVSKRGEEGEGWGEGVNRQGRYRVGKEVRKGARLLAVRSHGILDKAYESKSCDRR